jgi:cyanate lyase
MANYRKFDKEEATRLRAQEGLSYEEISTILGCSYAWCAKELRGVERGSYSGGMAQEVKLSTKAEAIAILEDALAKVREL